MQLGILDVAGCLSLQTVISGAAFSRESLVLLAVT